MTVEECSCQEQVKEEEAWMSVPAQYAEEFLSASSSAV